MSDLILFRLYGEGDADCEDCITKPNDWCPELLDRFCTMNCGPALVVNGVRVHGRQPRARYSSVIKQALSKGTLNAAELASVLDRTDCKHPDRYPLFDGARDVTVDVCFDCGDRKERA